MINDFRYSTMLLICLIFTLFLAFQQKAKVKASMLKQTDAKAYATQNDPG
jgi:Ni,Fe-hydrogenase I cytochrome b subunit